MRYGMVAATTVVLMVVAGCAGTSGASDPAAAPRYEAIDPAELDGPPADAEVIVRDGGEATTVTIAELEAGDLVRVELVEPFVGEETVFEGPLLGDVLGAQDVPVDATVELIALDDYRLTIELSELVASDAVVATRERGRPVPIAAGGPARLVFPDGTPLAPELDAWVWSVATIEVG